jgi:spore maturation protein CgeB
MRIVMFYHSLLSDWNHGNAHFLRGVATELISRGHKVSIYEPHDSWSLQNLIAEHGEAPIQKFHAAYPRLKSVRYDLQTLDLDEALDGADLVLVHEWNDHDLVRRIGLHRARSSYQLFFHDTHHRMITDSESMATYDLSNYDGVLAYGEILRGIYELSGVVNRAWTWHEAADIRIFRPLPPEKYSGELVWVGNWGDDERAAELNEFLIEPCKKLSLKARIHGVRYPDHAKQSLADAGIEFAGWLPNYEAPRVFSEFRCTVHVPRQPYMEALPGIPTIRIFEALACGIPLVCSPWDDVEGLFESGKDFLVARSGHEMTGHLQDLLHDQSMAADLAIHGLQTIRARHTCAHRVDELLAIYSEQTHNKEKTSIAWQND